MYECVCVCVCVHSTHTHIDAQTDKDEGQGKEKKEEGWGSHTPKTYWYHIMGQLKTLHATQCVEKYQVNDYVIPCSNIAKCFTEKQKQLLNVSFNN